MSQIKGYVDHIVYHNASNGYSVFELTAQEEVITCVGCIQTLDTGAHLELMGEYTEHAVYGRQFRFTSFLEKEPDGLEALERYLGSGALRGIGQALAARIVGTFKEDTLRIMEEEPERLSEIKGISLRKAMEISAQLEGKKELREAVIYLQGYGISNTMAIRLYQYYGDSIYRILRENPYQLVEDIDGIGFRRADELARRLGIRADSEFRIRSGILYCLQSAASDGHTCLPLPMLTTRAMALLEADEEAVSDQISNLAMEKKLVVRREGGQERVYASGTYYAELASARLLMDLDAQGGCGPLLKQEEEKLQDTVTRMTDHMEDRQEIVLDELQKTALLESIKRGVMILTGGPGTGKTTTINAMLRYYEAEGCDILLAAPTGRAAKRMSEATGYEARTIHRLLELNGQPTEEARSQTAWFGRNESNPLETDVLIVDEMSMVDIHLFYALLKALVPGTKLILVGDVDQLPSVGPGQVLRDLIASGAFAVVKLKKIFRQGERSDIVLNAHRINEGKAIRLDNHSRDFFFLERDNPQVIYKHMIQLLQGKLPAYVRAEPYAVQVLTPTRKGKLGVETLNRILQEHLNPPAPEKHEYQANTSLFREGDKVMQCKNNYQLEWEVVSSYGIPVQKGAGIFNGDVGILREISEAARTMTVEYDEGRRVVYSYDQAGEFELAYAITIHKSQGSEYPAVLIPLLEGPKQLFNRNILYTGVTRARNCVVLLGSRRTVEEMIANENEAVRYTGLGLRIAEIMDPAGGSVEESI